MLTLSRLAHPIRHIFRNNLHISSMGCLTSPGEKINQSYNYSTEQNLTEKYKKEYLEKILPANVKQLNPKSYRGNIKAVILDWSGTTADAHVIAPAVVFYNVFEKHGVPISMEEARLPMGLRKDLHIAKILEIPEVRQRWTEIKGQEPTQDDVDDLFADFVPMQIECLPEYCKLIPGTVEAVNERR